MPQARLRSIEVRDIWDAKAAFWDERMGEGNLFQLELIGPAVERLLALRPGERILEVGCGNGVSSRRLAHSARASWRLTTAPGFSSWRGYARKTSRAHRLPAGRRNERRTTPRPGEGQFDAIVCNMVLMDMPVIAPLVDCRPTPRAGGAVRLRRAAPRLQQQCRPPLCRNRDPRRWNGGDEARREGDRLSHGAGREGNRDARRAGAPLVLSPPLA